MEHVTVIAWGEQGSESESSITRILSIQATCNQHGPKDITYPEAGMACSSSRMPVKIAHYYISVLLLSPAAVEAEVL